MKTITVRSHLTEEAEDLQSNFNRRYHAAGCTCFISPPCSYCTDEGNPNNLDNDDSYWVMETREQTKQEQQWGTWR